ncbi:MAG TPA: GTPase Era [Woeseiaceae bacterium]|nr:GTPase Era [Woeseiaceae bacterium]
MARAFRAGFVAVVGRPNVGKSTLVNALVGSKVSIVTPKPQTTRHRILGVHTSRDAQVMFVDTPGLHRDAGKAMNRLMNRAAVNALQDADLVLFMCEADRWTEDDQNALARIGGVSKPVIALLNKIDRVHPKEELLGRIAAISAKADFVEVIPISARLNDNLDRLMSVIPGFLPESPPLFPEGMITDRSEPFHVAELVREQLTLNLRQEIPYGLTVQIEQYKKTDEKLEVHAVIWVERDSQKGIVVGKGGAVLKKIGRSVRLELKERLGVPVHIELWVKVKENWADNEEQLQRLGYDPG